MAEDSHALPDGGARGDHVLHDDHFFPGLGHIAHKHAALAVVLDLLAVKEEGHVEAPLAQGNGGGHGDGDALVGRAIEDGFLIAQLFSIGPGVKLAQSSDFLTGFDHAGIDEIGDLPSGLGGKVAEFQDPGLFQELNKFSFVAFHGTAS